MYSYELVAMTFGVQSIMSLSLRPTEASGRRTNILRARARVQERFTITITMTTTVTASTQKELLFSLQERYFYDGSSHISTYLVYVVARARGKLSTTLYICR